MFQNGFVICFGIILLAKGYSCGFRCPLPCDCSMAKCPKITTLLKCRLGYTYPVCGCCMQCLKEGGQSCGILNGQMLCGSGFLCKGERYINGNYVPGKCVSDGTLRRCPYVPKCNKPCKSPLYCKYGMGIPYCGCCPVCLRGPMQTCHETAPCMLNLECKHYFTYYGFPIFPGVCRPKYSKMRSVFANILRRKKLKSVPKNKKPKRILHIKNKNIKPKLIKVKKKKIKIKPKHKVKIVIKKKTVKKKPKKKKPVKKKTIKKKPGKKKPGKKKPGNKKPGKKKPGKNKPGKKKPTKKTISKKKVVKKKPGKKKPAKKKPVKKKPPKKKKA